MELTTWLTGLCVMAGAVWYVPRLLIAALLSLATIPYGLVREGVRPVGAGAGGRLSCWPGPWWPSWWR